MHSHKAGSNACIILSDEHGSMHDQKNALLGLDDFIHSVCGIHFPVEVHTHLLPEGFGYSLHSCVK